jgi:hypothetical protein
MALSRTILGLSAITLTMGLAACQSAGSDGAGPVPSATGSIALPADYRQRAAIHLVSDYVKDGVGPATISQPSGGRGLLGESASVIVRYPVRDQGFFAASGGTVTRCITVMSARSIETGGQARFSIARQRTDGQGCSGSDTGAPYGELETMAAKVRACRAGGEDRCLLSTNLPEAQARRLMNQR